MHSRIIELTLNPLDREDWAEETYFYDDDKIDYLSSLNEDERRESIEDWENGRDAIFRRLFTRGDGDTIIFKGHEALIKVHEEWIDSIKEEVGRLSASEGFDTFSVLASANQVLHSDYLFCLPDWTGHRAEYPRELLSWLDTLEDGTVLHIDAVFDCHY